MSGWEPPRPASAGGPGGADAAAPTAEAGHASIARRAAVLARLRVLHSLLGGLLLPAYLGYHLLREWSALSGPDAWVAAHPAPEQLGVPVGFIAVVAALLLHACIGLGLWPAGPRLSADPLERSLRPHQLVSGLLTLGFVGYHLWQVGFSSPGPHTSAYAGYAVLYSELGHPWVMAVYVVGVSALCFHLAAGWSRAASHLLFDRHAVALQLLRAVGGAAAFGLWLACLQLIALYATGLPLFP